jgi:hypothetical protein
MKRRNFIGLFVAALASYFDAQAQQSGKVWRIGHVLVNPPERGGAIEQSGCNGSKRGWPTSAMFRVGISISYTALPVRSQRNCRKSFRLYCLKSTC